MRALLVLLFVALVRGCPSPPLGDLTTKHAVAGTCDQYLTANTISVAVNTTCTIACQQDYVGTGTMSITCQDSGNWSPLNYICAPKTTTTTVPVDPTTTAATTTKAPESTTTAPTTTLPVDPTTTAATTTKAPDSTTTTAPTTTTAAPVTYTYVNIGENCTLLNSGTLPQTGTVFLCHGDGPEKATCVDGVCVAATTTVAPTTTAATTKAPESTTTTTAPTTTAATTKAPESTTTAATTTAAPTATIVPRENGQNCSTDADRLTNPTTLYVCVTGYYCKSGTCAPIPTNAPSTTAQPTTTQATTQAPTTQAPTTVSIVTIIYNDKGQSCTGDLAVNPRYLCKSPYRCSNKICIEVSTTTAPSTTAAPVYGLPGAQCGVGRPACLDGLNCTQDICTVYVPPTVAPPTITVSDVGGRCGGDSHAVCKTGLNCVPVSGSSTQNATIVGGTCVAPVTDPVACAPGTQPVTQNGVRVCVPCLYGFFSEKGTGCNRCPNNTYTPFPASFDPTVALTVGPIHCTPCVDPTTKIVANDPSCRQIPACDNCAAGSVCIWADSLYPSVSVVQVARCVAKICPACTTSQVCVLGECKTLSTDLDATAVTTITSKADALNAAGVDATTASGVSTDPTALTTPQTGNIVVVSGTTQNNVVAVTNTNQDGTIVVSDNVQVLTQQLNVNNGATTVLQDQATVVAGSVNVVSGVDGPTVARIAGVGDGGKVSFGSTNLDTNAIIVNGGVNAQLGTVNGDPANAFVQVSNATLDSTTLNVPLWVKTDGTQPASAAIKGRVEAKAIVGGGDLTVTGGSQLATNHTVSARLHVDGELIVGNTTLQGSLEINANGVLRITPKDPKSVPSLDAFQNCQGIIYFHIDGKCTDSRSGQLWTSTSNVNFACQIYIVGTDNCQVGPLNVKTNVLGHARRLLGATSDSGCQTGTGTSTVTSTGATYQVCGNPNSASSRSLSYIALFVTLFVTLLRF